MIYNSLLHTLNGSKLYIEYIKRCIIYKKCYALNELCQYYTPFNTITLKEILYWEHIECYELKYNIKY